jgi:Protein of unknown function (DUF3122)
MKKIIPSLLLSILILITTILFPPAASATLRQHQDAPGVMRYHSQISTRDDMGHPWQVILYKYINPGKATDQHLRLVGFPDVVTFVHPQVLEIETKNGQLLTAPDIYAQKAPAANVGEYQLTNILAKLPLDSPLKLYLPVTEKQRLSLTIPENAIAEWQYLLTSIDN